MLLTPFLGDQDREVEKLHKKFYDFPYPNFFDKFLCTGIISGDDNEIIIAGGVRTICEVVAITNKDVPIKERAKALYRFLQFTKHIAVRHGYKELHAFLEDEKWLKHNLRAGFEPIKGTGVILKVE